MADLLYWIWLNTVLTPGTETFAILHKAFSTPYEIYSADETTLRTVLTGRHAASVPSLLKKELRRSYAIMDFLARSDVGVVTYDDLKYPAPLRRIKNPPPVLYYKGTMPDFDASFCVSVVGSRKHREYVARHTFQIARELAIAGATIVSGLALGIDGVASAAALSGDGKVVAVIGSGIDIIYPKEHKKLAHMIESSGVIITEYPPGTPPYGKNFPIRNRIISALGRALLVTSGTLNSGTLITANAAKMQGKDIFAMPGDIDNEMSEAPSLLLREGARAVICAEDILFRYQDEYPNVINVFRILEKQDVNIAQILRRARVVSASDVRGKRVNPVESVYYCVPDEEETEALCTVTPKQIKAQKQLVMSMALERQQPWIQDVYWRIPEFGGCQIDELVTDECPISRVMIAVTSLEMAQLVMQTPGGAVARIDIE